jgi:hypothetical protein
MRRNVTARAYGSQSFKVQEPFNLIVGVQEQNKEKCTNGITIPHLGIYAVARRAGVLKPTSVTICTWLVRTYKKSMSI